MTGLRERKKSNRNRRIQDSALALFGKQGFAKTTISQIAEKADVGTGTVYNYYESKEEILFSIIQDRSSDYISKLQEIIDANKDVSESVAAFIDVYLASFSIYNKTIWRELIATGLSTKRPVMDFVNKIDSAFINKFTELLEKSMPSKFIKNGIAPSQIVYTIYNLLIAAILRYISKEKMSLSDLRDNLMGQIRVILATNS